MRDGLQEGFNILYGSGDSYSLAFSKLTEVVRKAEEDYTVEFIGGLNPKDDGKNKFFAIVMARLKNKDRLTVVEGKVPKASEYHDKITKFSTSDPVTGDY